MRESNSSKTPVMHCAITRIVRAGKEAEFEEAVKQFVARSMSHYGTTGAHVLRPTSASRPREYGILRSFNSREHMQEFYDSDLFAAWQEEVADLVEGDSQVKELHGLEAFFRTGTTASPPRWKMAVVTWLGVFPVVLLFSQLLAPRLGFLHPVLVTAIVTAVAVPTLTWLVMPSLTRLFARWLRPTPW